MAIDPFITNRWETRWELVRARGWFLLEHSSSLQPVLVVNGLRTHWLRLRLWVNPGGLSESEPMSLSVFDPFDHASYKPMVREVIWHCRSDWRRFHGMVEDVKKGVSLEPTFAVRDADVPADRLKAMLYSGSALLVPLVWMDETESVTSDAGEMGFEFFSRHQPPAVLRLRWSWETPEQWDPAKAWVARLHDFLDSCLKHSK
jgi:hypothetical protein